MREFVRNPPDASALMTSARSFGNYDLAGAFADLIDNSIQADASTVELFCRFQSGDPEIRIVDNGHGMTEEELRVAMRPASANPVDERGPRDLGRFGWGLKSASFSQCRKLTVLSRQAGTLCGATWDLDDIADWKMGVLSDSGAQALCSPSIRSADGTEVIWNDCDRLSEGRRLSQTEFNAQIVHARGRLGLTFHRFLSGEAKGRPRLNLLLNGDPIPAYDPFYRQHPATQTLEAEVLRIDDGSQVHIQPFILPHYRFLGSREFEEIAGDEGMLKNQGFYVYRNDRLILHGTWFRLIHHGELSQLVRVSVDVPNSLDEMWRLTLDKKKVQLPSVLQRRLRQLVMTFRSRSHRAYRAKGGKVPSTSGNVEIWSRLKRGGSVRYEINREHPLIEALFLCDEENRGRSISAALLGIEQSFPVAAFAADAARDDSVLNQAPTTPEGFREFLKAAIPVQLVQHGGDVSALTKTLAQVEPFKSNWKTVEDFLRDEGFTGE